ncbi:MAG: hypothetical protein Q4B28_04270 [bacterium]|nr:hypothetical protein [bacterium]
MAVKNAIEIIISATDNASAVFAKSANGLKGVADKMQQRSNQNEYALNRMHNVGKQVFSTLSSHIVDFTDKAGKTKEAEEAMDRLSKNLNLNSKDILK